MAEVVEMSKVLGSMFGGAAIFALIALHRKWWTPWHFYDVALKEIELVKEERDKQTEIARTSAHAALTLTEYFRGRSSSDGPSSQGRAS